MSYIVLARKYRPQTFEEVVGQPHVCQVLKNSITQKRIGHAYLFSGQRGTGKTTVARIFTKALNCIEGPKSEPCNKCTNCKQITEGNSIDVLEIDGASNRGIDEIRALRDNVKFTPASSKYKIYIIDESHQITPPAFNALLKTLEEPPEHILFILATTQPQKIPLTILSRCQRFRFSPISTEDIVDKLENIAKKEKFNIDKDAIMLIARIANGSLRDSLSILDQIVSISPAHKVTHKIVTEFLGLSPVELTSSFVDLVINKDSKGLLTKVQYIAEQGYDFLQFVRELREYFHKLMAVSLMDNENAVEKHYTPEEKKFLMNQKNSFDTKVLLRYLYLINRCIEEMKWSDNPRLIFELYLLKIVQPVVDIDELIKRVETIQKKLNITSISSISKKDIPEKPDNTKNKTVALPAEQTFSTKDIRQTKEKIKEYEVQKEIPSENIEEIDDVDDMMWKKVLDEIKEKKMLIANSLELARIKMPSENMLTAYLPEGFHFDMVNKYSHIIEETISKVFYRPIKLVCEPTKEKLQRVQPDNVIFQHEEEQPSEIHGTEAAKEDETITDPELKKVIEGLSGKIIK